MNNSSEEVVASTMQEFISNLNEALHVFELAKNIPKYNQSYPIKISHNTIFSQYLPHPPLKRPFHKIQLFQDSEPNRIPLDQFSTNGVKPHPEGTEIKILRIQDHLESAQTNRKSSRYRKTGQTMRGTSLSMRNNEIINEKELKQKYFIVPPNKNTEIIQLKQQQPSEEQIREQDQLNALKKRLYYSRELKKMQEIKQFKRIQELRKRKKPQVPKSDFTYAFDGKFMPRKLKKRDDALVDQIKVSQSFDELPKKERKKFNLMNQEELSEQNFLSTHMRFKKAQTFNNFNKRQISHLPFIQMTENAKIKQENKVSEGSHTQRVTLKNFELSNQENGFKHHNQIQKQRREKQLLMKMEERRAQEEINFMIEQPVQNDNSIMKKRQSYAMNRYLKKWRQSNPETNRRSFNFSRANFPKNTPIHNYYKHDFNTERKMYESEIFSKVLDA